MSKVNALGQKILENKYYAPGETTPEDVFARVAKVGSIPDVVDALAVMNVVQVNFVEQFAPYEDVCARVLERRNITVAISSEPVDHSADTIKQTWEDEAEKYYKAMCNLEFMPGTPTLINAGRPTGMLSSCFFLRIPDSMEGIFECVKQVALISKMGGGVGLDLSDLRPEGSVVTNTNGTSSGPISFLKVFNETGNQVQQGGIRRAALIAIMRVDHPDILKFIKCKEEEGTLSNFNMSVLITDEFMEALESNGEIVLHHDSNPGATKIKAKEIWDLIVDKAWSNGEPGVAFWDELNRGDIFEGKYGKLGLNPCGEQTLLPYEACNLAAINLAKCCRFANKEHGYQIDQEKIARLTALGIRFLDNMIDINKFPIPEIEERTLKTRRVGLGTMGLHDLMLRKEIRYGSPESLALIDEVYSTFSAVAKQESVRLGAERGIPIALRKHGRRNSGLVTVQPTGTVSIICNQTSSAIEPVFKWEYPRNDSYGTHEIKHFMLDEYTEDTLPAYAVTALQVSPAEHVAVQAQVQKYIDSSISKTVNLVNSASNEDVDKTFRLAYKSKCKSVTIYRTGSRKTEVLVADPVAEEPITKLSYRERPRPQVLFGATFKISTPGGKAYITVNEDDYGLREVFVHISKAGSEITTHVEAEGRLISHALKNGMLAETIIKHLAGHKSNPIFDNGRVVKSVPDAISIVMQEFKDQFEGFSEFIDCNLPIVDNVQPIPDEISGELCPDCGEVLYMSSGCNHCTCGFSRCG